jgi:hypothetical protein
LFGSAGFVGGSSFFLGAGGALAQAQLESEDDGFFLTMSVIIVNVDVLVSLEIDSLSSGIETRANLGKSFSRIFKDFSNMKSLLCRRFKGAPLQVKTNEIVLYRSMFLL